MRPAILLALLCSGCASAWAASPPGSRNGVLHGVAAAGATWASDRLTGVPWYGFVLTCSAFVAHEWEESRGFSDWSVSGKTDGILDMVVPCSTGFSLSMHLR